uniref:Uncharacterized protein n=1 Tax=Klebsiella pneumoniae TaxID=573 RepID=A0A8B0STW8_KLEPN|nr:hypothetical protein [Klebsiella pneumoniae]
MILTAHRPVEEPVKRKGSLKPYIFWRFIRRGTHRGAGIKIPFRRRIDSSKPTCRQKSVLQKNGSDHRFRFSETTPRVSNDACLPSSELSAQSRTLTIG